MPSSLNYETIEALIYDPVVSNRGAMRAALSALGFRHIDCVSAPVDFAYANFRRNPDIVFCEIVTNEMMLCDQIQALRLGTIGNNPFVVVVATTWDHSEALIKRVLNCGADDLILRPFSNGILSTRLEALVERRKGFVITHDYVGPDRRRDPKRVSSGLFDPPNSFGLKAAGLVPVRDIERHLGKDLTAAKSHLFKEKLRVDVFQIGVLSQLLQETTPTAEIFAPRRERLMTLCRTVMQRGGEAKIAGIDLWCKEVLSAIQTLESEKNPAEAYRFMDRAAGNLYQIVNTAKTIDEYRAELDGAIKIIHERIASGKPV